MRCLRFACLALCLSLPSSLHAQDASWTAQTGQPVVACWGTVYNPYPGPISSVGADVYVRNPNFALLDEAHTSGPNQAYFSVDAPLNAWDRGGTYSCGVFIFWYLFGVKHNDGQSLYTSYTNPNCGCSPTWDQSRKRTGIVLYRIDSNVTDSRIRNAVSPANGYWNGVKGAVGSSVGLGNGGSNGIPITMAPPSSFPSSNVPAMYKRDSNGDRIMINTSLVGQSQQSWEWLIAHEFGHMLGWNDVSNTGCSPTSGTGTVMRTNINLPISLSTPVKNGDHCAYNSDYHPR